MFAREKLNKVIDRFDQVEAQLASAPQADDFVRLSKEYSDLSPVVEVGRELLGLEEEYTGLQDMLEDPEADAEMSALARDELGVLDERMSVLQDRLKILLLPKDAADDKSAILEIRAGTGGDEAALFAGDLFRMYQRYAEANGWKLDLMSVSEADLGGYKEIIAEISGKGVFARLKFESGVHRVQRVPETESGGRIHTSAATVAVLPEAEDVDIEVEDKDLRVDVYRASGARRSVGQHHRQRGAHHAPADRHRRHPAG